MADAGLVKLPLSRDVGWSQELLENVDLEQFWTLLSECGGDKINFDQFSSVAQQVKAVG